MSLKKIAFLHRGLTFGGVEKWMSDLANHAPAGFQVSRIVTEGLYEHPVIVKSFPSNIDFVNLKKIEESESEKIDYPSFFNNIDLLVVPAGIPNLDKYVKGLDIPIIMVSHGVSYSTASQIKWTYKNATHYAAVCPAATKVFPEHLEVSVIYNGVSTQQTKKEVDASLFKEAWDIPKNLKIVLQVARHSEEKNPRAIIQALLGLPEDEWIGLSIGEGPMTPILIEEAAAYVPKRLIFGKPDTDVFHAMMASDVLLIGSDTEALPYVMLEAFSRRLPVVSTRFPEVTRLLTKYSNLVSPISIRASSKEIAQAILKFKNIDTEQAYTAYQRFYDLESSMSLWYHYFDGVLKNYNTPGFRFLIPGAKTSSEIAYL